MPRYYIATYGCQMNEYDSGLIAKILDDAGYSATEDPGLADVLLFNTCSVREKAEESAIARISKMKPYKESNPDLKIVVTGCMAENLKDSLLKKRHIIDFVVGPDSYRKLPEILAKVPSKRNRAARVFAEFDTNENYTGLSAVNPYPFSAYVAIQRGCNKHCSYCIVPYVRGPEKYRDAQDVLREVQELAAKGVSEVTLLGQTVNAYKNGNDDFAAILNKVSEVDGIRRIRFTSPHPKHYTPALIDTILGNPKICPHVHLPLQSGSDAMLKKMHRQHTAEEFLRIVEKFRGKDPLYGLSTDIICGFVGETDDDFEQTLKIVREAQFDSAFMFIYSPRPGTESARETETLTPEQKLERHGRLVELQNAITLERNKLMLGRREEILVERPSSKDPSEWVGKTGNFKKVVFRPSREVRPGDYLVCNIDDIRGWTLRGTPVEKE